jgi:hypothetical protein
LDFLEESCFSEGVADGFLIAGVDCGAVDVELSSVEREAGMDGSIVGVNRLMKDGFVIGVTVELRV